MKIQLSDKFTYSKLLKFTFPTIIMMVFTSIYGVVDGIFVSNFAGKIPFTAINLIMPVFLIIGTIGFMIGTGGSALVAKFLGEGRKEKANEVFSMLIYLSLVVSAVISFLRTLLFQVLSVVILPFFFGLDGIWFSIILAELLSLIVVTLFMIKYKY